MYWTATSPASGRPSARMSDRQWQNKFQAMRAATVPAHRKRYGCTYSRESGTHNEERHGAYKGTTNYQNYCAFINDALATMRHGGRTLCFYTYQMADLLRFEPKALRTRYVPEDEWWVCWLQPEARAPSNKTTSKASLSDPQNPPSVIESSNCII